MPRRSGRQFAVFLMALVALSGCVDQSKPVFDVFRLDPTPCVRGSSADECFRATIRNVGNERGSGVCEITAYAKDGVTVVGNGRPVLRFANIGPGKTIHRYVELYLEGSTDQYVSGGGCDPGPGA